MMGIKLNNNASSLLAATISASDVTISVTAGEGALFPTLGVGDYFYAVLQDVNDNIEIVKVTARSTDAMTIVRAQEGTTARTWAGGDIFEQRMTVQTFYDYSAVMVAASNTLKVDRTSATGSAEIPSGTTAQRDATPTDGWTRFNSTITGLESFFSTTWNKILTALDIGVTVQAYDAATAKTNVDQSWTGSQRGAQTTDNDGSFDLNLANNFKCTPTATFALTFTNHTEGQSGYVLLVNTGGYAVSAAATTKASASFLANVSAAGTYLLSYYDDGTNTYVTSSGALV